MAREGFSQMGSGTVGFLRGILGSEARGALGPGSGQGIRGGTQVLIINPEDLNSVDAFAVSGVSIGISPTKIWDANIDYILPRQGNITLQNDGPSPAYIGPNSTSVISPSGWMLATTAPNNRQSLPFLKNIEIWARSDGTSSIRIMAW